MSTKNQTHERVVRRTQLSLNTNSQKNQQTFTKSTDTIKMKEDNLPSSKDRLSFENCGNNCTEQQTNTSDNSKIGLAKESEKSKTGTDRNESQTTPENNEINIFQNKGETKEKVEPNNTVQNEKCMQPKSGNNSISNDQVSEEVTSTENKNLQRKTQDVSSSSKDLNEKDDQKLSISNDDTPPVKRNLTLTTDINPTATSTPGKTLTDKGTTKHVSINEPLEGTKILSNIQISARRSIHNSLDITPSKLYSYRQVNNELDNSGLSMNVTVGSDVHNNTSFSFCESGRKRHQSLENLQNGNPLDSAEDQRNSANAKRAKLEKSTFMSVITSPLSKLRSRFAKASVNNSKYEEESFSEEGVQNVTGIEDMLPDKAKCANKQNQKLRNISGCDPTPKSEDGVDMGTLLNDKVANDMGINIDVYETNSKKNKCALM